MGSEHPTRVVVGVLLYLCWPALAAASYETTSLRQLAISCPTILVGVVEQLDEVALDDGSGRHGISSARVRVERWLKGPAEADTIELEFDTGLLGTAVESEAFAYHVGQRQLLCLDPAPMDGRARAPVSPFHHLVLDPLPPLSAIPLVQYIELLIAAGAPGLQVTCTGPATVAPGDAAPCRLTVRNGLPYPVAVACMGYPAPHPDPEAGVVFWCGLEQRGVGAVARRTGSAEPIVTVPPGQEATMAVDLSGWFALQSAGSYDLVACLDLPAGGRAVYRDLWRGEGSLHSLTLTAPTVTPQAGWGATKARRGGHHR